jgi:hypothetical protein
VKAVLERWQVQDIEGTLYRYVQAGVKRGVAQKLFGKYVKDPNSGKVVMDPLFLINHKLRQALDAGHLTADEHQFATDKAIPALFGQLGIDADPRWRSVSTWATTYQNVRLLSMVLLTSIMDPSIILSRGGVAATWKGLRDVVAAPRDYTENLRALEMLGAMRNDLTEHVTNDVLTGMYYGSGPQKINETFFRLTQMHRWTNLTRVMALTTAKHYLHDHAIAAEGSLASRQKLAALGLEAKHVLAWEAADRPMGDRNFLEINAALNQFVDDAVLRPTAAIRAAWMSDVRFMIFAHLKSFAFAFYERALRQVWTESIRIWGEKQGPMKAMAVMPAITLAVPALALAALGYELRKELGWFGDQPEWMEKDGVDYFSEIVQRAGLLGPVQFLLDAEESADRGQLMPLALLGPTVSQLQDIDRGAKYAFLRALPLLNQLPAARMWANQQLTFDRE